MKRKKNSKRILLIAISVMFCIMVFMPIKNGSNNQMEQSVKDDKIAQGDELLNEENVINVQLEKSSNENDKIKKNNVDHNDIDNEMTQHKNNSIEDIQTPEDIDYVEINNENKICSSFILGEFNNGRELSTEQYLKVVYNALNNGYISSNKTNYSEEEINNFVYSIFNVKLNEHKSVEGLTYTKGIYTVKKTEGQKIELTNIQKDVAAGNTYVEFEVNGEKYVAKLGTNTITGETYVASIIED